MASNPMHSTLARSQALHAGNFPSHFCFLDRQRVQLLIALATLYCCSSEPPRGDAGVWALLAEDLARFAGGREEEEDGTAG
jgi:hypothetical protein